VAANRSTVFRLEVSLGDASFSAEGESQLVFQAFETFRGELRAPGKNSREDQKPKDLEVEEDAGDGGKDEKSGNEPDPHAAFAKGTPLPVFLKENGPKTNPSAVAVMAVWANANQGTTEFTTDVIEELWKRSGRKKAGNLARDIGDAANSGWLDRASRGKYTLPSYGIDYVRGLTATKE
jgi:hypothetical protein